MKEKTDFEALTVKSLEVITTFDGLKQKEWFELLDASICRETWRNKVLKPNIGHLWTEHPSTTTDPRNLTYSVIDRTLPPLKPFQTEPVHNLSAVHPLLTSDEPVMEVPGEGRVFPDILVKTYRPPTKETTIIKSTKWEDAHISLVFRHKQKDLYEDLEAAAEYNLRTIENEILFRLYRR